jgi:hypothetical protein
VTEQLDPSGTDRRPAAVDPAGSAGLETHDAAAEGHSGAVAPLLGRVGAPRGAEATSEEFHIWVPDHTLAEKTQLVKVQSVAGRTPVAVYGLVTEVRRRSRRADILEESDRYDNTPEATLALTSGGVTHASVRVLATEPAVLTPPREEAPVFAATAGEAQVAYGMAEMSAPAALGLIRNGGQATAGPAMVDLDYLLGALGGHLNVTGIAGVGTKSSFLTGTLAQILASFAATAAKRPAAADNPQARAVVLNVKGLDLFWLDHWSQAFTPADAAMWAEMGVAQPRPLQAVFYAPQMPGGSEAVPVGRSGVRPYSWSLADILDQDVLNLLFADSDRDDDNFALLLADVERLLVQEDLRADGTVRRTLRPDAVARSFRGLLDWFEAGLSDHPPTNWTLSGPHHQATLRRFYRRLRRIAYEDAGVLRMEEGDANPLDVRRLPTDRPAVIDLSNLADPHLQRFVVATLFKQAADDQTGPAALRGMHYLFVLDELNRFAPKGASDPITKLIELVAAELRSRGVILLGAQQQASLVSVRVIENASIRVLGRTGSHELRADVHGFLPTELRSYVETMAGGDKVVSCPTFRQPMLVRVPRPPWAMRRAEATADPPAFLGPNAPAAVNGPPRLRPRSYAEQRL